VDGVGVPVALLCAWLLSAAPGPAGKRYCESPQEYVRDFEASLITRDRGEDNRLKRAPGPAMLDAREVEGLLLLLESPEWEARDFACYMLGRRRAVEAVDALIEHLGDENERVREKAAEALGRIADPRAFDPLLERLDDPAEMRGKRGSSVRASVARALGLLGEAKAGDALLGALADESVGVLRNAAFALGRLGEKRAVGPLVPLLKHRHRDVVADAARALGLLGAAGAAGDLLALLDHKDAPVRAAAAEALGRLEEKRAVEELIGLLSSDKDRGVRAAAAASLGRLGEDRAVPALRKALEDRNHSIQARAAKALLDLKQPDAMGELLAVFEKRGENNRIHPVGNCLREIGDAAVPVVMKGLADPKKGTLRGNSAVAAGLLGQPCLKGSLELLDSPHAHVRMAACSALANIRDPSVIPRLVEVLNDPESGVQRNAAYALAGFGRRTVPELISAAGSPEKTTMLPALEAMARVRDHRLVPVLVEKSKHADKGVRTATLWALGAQYHNDAMPAVVARLGDSDPGVRQRALEVIERNPWVRSSAAKVAELLGDESAGVRGTALRALRALAEPETVPRIAAYAAAAKDERVRKRANDAVEHIGKVQERRRKEEERRAKRELAERERRAKEEEERRRLDAQPPDKKPVKPPPPPPDPGDEEPL
jgi:HEAT repeat protein